MATARNKKSVDKPVENQENPGTSEEVRPSSDSEVNSSAPKSAPANEVDATVKNQESPGGDMVDRNPGPQVVTDSAGIAYDVSKPEPELIQDQSREAEKNRIRQQEGVLDTSDLRNDENVFTLVFKESGLTTSRSWKKGEELRVEESHEEPWMKYTADEQKDKYGRVMFERK